MSTALDNAGPQLQRRHAGRVAGDGQGAPGRAATARSATRSAPAARAARSPSSRSPTPTPASTRGSCPQCSFPDAWSIGAAARRLPPRRAGTSRTRRKWGTGRRLGPRCQIAAVEGHPNHVNSIVFDTVYWTSLGDPGRRLRRACRREDNYNAQTQPGRRPLHARRLHDQRHRAAAVERLGPGRAAGRPRLRRACRSTTSACSTGSSALKQGRITPAQFVDLNAKIGGARHRHQADRRSAQRPTSRRSPAPTAAAAINSTNNLDRVAIIDLRGPDPGAFHDAYRSWAIRARLEREHGTSANQVIWFGAVPLMGDVSYANEGLLAMDRWLGRGRDRRRARHAGAEDHPRPPGDVHDRCSQVDGVELVTLPGVGTVCELEAVQTRFGTPRTVAGEGIATDVNKCTLKPLRRTRLLPDHVHRRPVGAAADGVPEPASATGARPGVSQVGHDPVADLPGRERATSIYGGQPLGPAPAGSGRGWTSDAFASWRY